MKVSLSKKILPPALGALGRSIEAGFSRPFAKLTHSAVKITATAIIPDHIKPCDK